MSYEPPERELYKSSTWIVKVPRIIGLNSRSSMTMRRDSGRYL